MLLIPAIDIQNGKCVRLRQGNMDDSTIYSTNPIDMARTWVKAGARRLHLVDLDGAVAGNPVNKILIKEIVAEFPDIPVQVGGGIRDEDTVTAYLEAGVQYIIIGTQAIKMPHFVSDMCLEFPGRIIVGLDAKDGKVATDGWSKLTRHDVVDLAQHFENDGVVSIIYTDISRDGMLQGVNVDATLKLARAVTIPIIASGGVNNLDDLRGLCKISDEGIVGVITGRAIYEGTLDFAAGQKLCDDLTKK